jgi:hypothetical protein
VKVGDLVRYYGREELGIVVKVSDSTKAYKAHIVYVWFGSDEVVGQYSKHSLKVIK